MSKRSSSQLSRRKFVKGVTVITGALIGVALVLPGLDYLISPGLKVKETEKWIPVGPLNNYEIGIPKLFNFNLSEVNGWEKTVLSFGAFVIRKDETNVLVLSNICTHLACRVSWHPDIKNYVSPCHNGHFDIYGNVISGPPPRPLDEFQIKVENGILSILFPAFKRS
jgi:menaquinol-cytochrome c reductase iron-sulfur subunit